MRMCKECFDFYANAKDIEVPCQNKACTNKWVWTRSMQLGAHVHGVNHTPVRLCDDCLKAFMSLKDEERPCSVQGCTGTWTYTVKDQIRDKCNQREEPKRRCASCQEFLQNHKAEDLTCEHEHGLEVACDDEFHRSFDDVVRLLDGAADRSG